MAQTSRGCPLTVSVVYCRRQLARKTKLIAHIYPRLRWRHQRQILMYFVWTHEMRLLSIRQNWWLYTNSMFKSWTLNCKWDVNSNMLWFPFWDSDIGSQSTGQIRTCTELQKGYDGTCWMQWRQPNVDSGTHRYQGQCKSGYILAREDSVIEFVEE